MNYRLVFKVYSSMRQMTDEESALLNTLRGMSETDQQLMIETLAPQKATKKPAKKVASKSRKAASLAEQVKSAVRPLDDGVSKMRCTASVDDNGGQMPCGEYADANVHHLNTDPDYHEFVGSETAAAASGD